MSRVKEITVSLGYTYQPAAYHSAKGEVTMVVEVGEDEDADVVAEETRREAALNLIRNLAGVETIHQKIDGGLDPSDLLEEEDVLDQDEIDGMLTEDLDDFE